MNKDDNYIFPVSISKDAYKNKLETKAAVGGIENQPLRDQLGIKRICYYRISMTAEKLLECVLNGYTFCALFSNFRENYDKQVFTLHNGDYFTAQGKAGEFFEGSYFIGVDIDDTHYLTSEELIGKLTLPPTFWYTSLSHMGNVNGRCKGLRLRLVYVFNTMISDKYYFRYCASQLHKILERDLGEEMKEKCGLSRTEYFNGTNWNDKSLQVEFDISNIIYSLSDISVSDSDYFIYLTKHCEYKNPKKKEKFEIDDRIRILSLQLNLDPPLPPLFQFVSDCDKSIHSQTVQDSSVSEELISKHSISGAYFYRKYKHKYPYIYRTEKDEWEKLGDIEYQWCDDSYFELPWIHKKIADGQHRRHSLFHRAWMRRLIMPEITPDIMFFNLAVDCERFFDNSDGQLSTDVLIAKVREAFESDVESIIENNRDVYDRAVANCRKKKIIVRWKPGQMKINTNKLSKEIRWTFIDKIYDVNLTLQENIQILEDSGFIISGDSLRRYCKARGIVILTPVEKRYRKFKELHIDGLSLRKELVLLEQHGLNIQLKTLQNYRARLKQEAIDR